MLNFIKGGMSLDKQTKERISRIMFGGKFVLAVMIIILKYLQPMFSDFYFCTIILSLILIRSAEAMKITTKWFSIVGADYIKEMNKSQLFDEEKDDVQAPTAPTKPV
jgi:hypothetical protein